VPDRFHDSVVGRHAAPRPSDAHERAAAAKKLGDFVRSSGDLGGGGGFSELLNPPAGLLPATPTQNLRPLSAFERDTLDKWGQGSGLIDPTRTGTDPELIGRLRGELEPSPWEGDVRWKDFFTGKGLFGEGAQPQNAVIGGRLVGPGGSAPISVGQSLEQGSLKDQLLGLAKGFDPRKGESFLNYAGLFGGPRRVSPHVVRMKLQGVLDDHPVSTEMGFGHAESSWPSAVGGVTLHRVQATNPRSDRSPFYNPPEWKTHTLSEGGSYNPYYIERGRRGAGSDPSRRGMELAYNWVDDASKEILGSIEMRVHPDHSYTGWIHFKKDDPRSAFFATDTHKIHQGIGKIARAHISSDSRSKAGTNWAQVMATAGTVHPVYSWFTQKYGRLKDLEMTDLVGIGHENYGMNDPNPPAPTPPPPSIHTPPSPTPFPPRPHGSNLPGDEWQPGPGSGSYEPGTFGHLANTISRRLDNDGHNLMVDEIHNANLASPRDRVLHYLTWMRNSGHYTPRQIAYYRGQLTRIGYQDRPRTATEAARAMFVRLEQDNWGREARDIRESSVRADDRIGQALQFMRDADYHPDVIRYFEDMVPEGVPLGPSRQAPARSTAASERTASEAESAMADWMITHGYLQDQIRIFNQHDNMAARARAYFQVIHRDPNVDAATLARFRALRPNLGRRTPSLDRTAWMGALEHVQRHLRSQGFELEVAEIARGNPLRGEGAYARRFQAYISLMRSLNFSPQEIAEFAARAPAARAVETRTPAEIAHASARAHLEQQRAHHANEQRQREIEDEMDSIGHYPPEGSAAYQRYQQLGEEWSRLQGESDPIDFPQLNEEPF
jgi:hypothetical protein